MRTSLKRTAAALVALVTAVAAAPPPAWPQIVTPVAQSGAPQAQFSDAALDQLLAPIALYPDQLLGQILMASTYPLEVVQAARWVGQPQNAALRGDRLAAALQPIDWDPSVKALVPFPQILTMMDQHLDWMQNLGDAFIGQQADVMESVQRLRRQAAAAGNLNSTPQQTVTMVGPDYVVQPANPTVIYVPVYNPNYVYGAWLYPLYPPFYFPPPPRFLVGPVYHDVGFSIGVAIIRILWGWDSWDWRHHRLHIDRDRYNAINRYFIDHDRRPRLTQDTWRHDAYHRRGVVYRDSAVQQRFRPSPPSLAPAQTRAFRGYESIAPAARPTARTTRTGRRIEAAPRAPVVPRAPQITVPRAPVVPQPRIAAPSAPPRTAERRPAAPQRRVEQRRFEQRPVAPAFQGFTRGSEVRAEARRGRESRQTMAPSRAAKPAAAPARAPAKAKERRKQPARGGPDRRDDRQGR